MIPADRDGNKLFLKEPREENNRLYVKYRSSYNDIPFVESEVFLTDGGKNGIITGEDGTVLWRFPIALMSKIAK